MVGLVLALACAADPGEADDACIIEPVAPGAVRALRIVCEEQLVSGGEGRVGDWLLENAVARYVVRGEYASLTQLGEEGGGLVDAMLLDGGDALMELLPLGVRSPVGVVETGDEPGSGTAAVQAGDFTWRLAADDPALTLEGSLGPPDAVWVPRPGAARTGAVSRREGDFFAVVTDEVPSGEGGGQLFLRGLAGVQPAADAFWDLADVAPTAVDADAVELLDATGNVLDRLPVVGGAAALPTDPALEPRGFRPGCAYDGLTLRGCGGLDVRARDDAGRPLAVTVHFASTDLPLPEGGGRAPLGTEAGEVWVWAGPGFGAWRGWFDGGEEAVAVTLSRVLPPERDWAEAASPTDPATWTEGGVLLGDFALEVAPDGDHATYSADALHAARAEGVGFAVLLADDEVPVAEREAHDNLRAVVGSRAGGDAWAWGFSSTTRRAGHGAVDAAGFDARDRLTLVRGGLSADRFTIVTPEWVGEALAEAPAWAWPVRPDALWLRELADLDTLTALCEAWIDVQPLARRTWLPYVGATSPTAALRAVYDRNASAGNGPMITLESRSRWGMDPRPALSITVSAPGWMGPVRATLHTRRGERLLALDADGRAHVQLTEPTWAFVVAEAARAQPWGGEAAWAVSGVRWFDQPGG
jgi:hypothetical protein